MPSIVMDIENERINRLKVVLAEKNCKGKWLAEQLGKIEKKDGSIIEFTVDEISNFIKDLRNFVDNIELQISTCNILKTL